MLRLGVPRLRETTWPDVAALRANVDARLTGAATVEDAAGRFAELMKGAYPSIVLARVFLVLPLAELPPREAAFATALAARLGAASRLVPTSPVLTLVGTRGDLPAWNDRLRSDGHLAIPLIDREMVDGAPMIARLLGDLGVDCGLLASDRAVATRKMLGGINGRFYVADADNAVDELGRAVIPSRDFVKAHAIRTVFGMGGAYIDGTLVIAIFFCTESLDAADVDRFPTLINHLKMATSALRRERRVFRGCQRL